MRHLTLFFCAALLSGCAGPFVQEISVPNDILNRLNNQIPTVTASDISSFDFSVITKVEATSCFNNLITDSASSETDAMRQLKYKAAQYNADALLNPICTKEGTSLAKNCWTSVTCVGDAIRINGTTPPQQGRKKEQEILTISLL